MTRDTRIHHYRDFEISQTAIISAPRWQASHKNYDGEGDPRHATADSLDEIKAEIDAYWDGLLGELENCPFCGGQELVLEEGGVAPKAHWCRIACRGCLSGGPEASEWNARSVTAACEAWNEREER